MKIDKNELRIILAAYGAKISTEDKNLANRNYYWCDDGSDDHQALISMASNGLAVHAGGQGTRLLFVFTDSAADVIGVQLNKGVRKIDAEIVS